jgi:hypothetical protein
MHSSSIIKSCINRLVKTIICNLIRRRRIKMRHISQIVSIVERNLSLEIDETLENSRIEDSRLENRMHCVSHTNQMHFESHTSQNEEDYFDSRNTLYVIRKNVDQSITRQKKERIQNETSMISISSKEIVLNTNDIYSNELLNMRKTTQMRMK